MNANLNLYKNLKTPTVVSGTTADEWFNLIRGSQYSDIIKKARTGVIDYDEVKTFKLPCVTYNFLYDSYKKDSNIISSTGLMYIDIDDPSFNPEDIDSNKIYASYHSFGGYGWGLVIRVDGLTKENFKYNYERIVDELKLTEYVDTNAIKPSQFNVLSYDPNINVNQKAVVFEADEKHPPLVSNNPEKKAYTHEWGVFSNTLRFDNLDDYKFEGNYITNWEEGFNWIRCWIPIKKKDINRNKTLLSYCNNLVWLNPNITKERCLKVLQGVNQVAFQEPVEVGQLRRVVNSIFSYKEDGTLKPILDVKKRKIIISKTAGLSYSDKRSLVLELLAERKAEVSIQKLYDIIEDWDWSTYGKISQKKIYKNHPISKKTVEKYWSEFKEFVAELNQNWKDSKIK